MVMADPENQSSVPASNDVTAPEGQSPVQGQSATTDPTEAFRRLNERAPQTGLAVQLAMGLPGNPIQQKVTEHHITQALEMAKGGLKNDFELKKQKQASDSTQAIVDRVFQLLIVAAGFAMIVVVIRTFKDQPSVLVPVLTGLGGFIAGLLSGVGIGRSSSKP